MRIPRKKLLIAWDLSNIKEGCPEKGTFYLIPERWRGIADFSVDLQAAIRTHSETWGPNKPKDGPPNRGRRSSKSRSNPLIAYDWLKAG